MRDRERGCAFGGGETGLRGEGDMLGEVGAGGKGCEEQGEGEVRLV